MFYDMCILYVLRLLSGFFGTRSGFFDEDRLATLSSTCRCYLEQGPPNRGPRAKSGPRSHFIRPEKTFC